MNSSAMLELIEDLDDNIEDLEEILAPLMADALSASTKKLPLLDRAKLYVTVVYAVESLLFSYLRLNGADAKEHAVFKELARVKQYFEKMKDADVDPKKPNLSLNKQAAARIIQHSLAGNDKYDLERREREAREKFLAARKLKALELTMKAKATAAANTPESDPAHVAHARAQAEAAEGAAEAAAEEAQAAKTVSGQTDANPEDDLEIDLDLDEGEIAEDDHEPMNTETDIEVPLMEILNPGGDGGNRKSQRQEVPVRGNSKKKNNHKGKKRKADSQSVEAGGQSKYNAERKAEKKAKKKAKKDAKATPTTSEAKSG